MIIQKLPEDRKLWIDIYHGDIGDFFKVNATLNGRPNVFHAVEKIIRQKKETTGNIIGIGSNVVVPIVDAYTTYCFMDGVPYNSDSDGFDNYWKENKLEMKVIDAFSEAVGVGISGLYFDGQWKNVPSEYIYKDENYFIQIPVKYKDSKYMHIIRFDDGVDHRLIDIDGVEYPSVFESLYPGTKYGLSKPYKESPFVVFDFRKSLFADCIDWIQAYVFYCIVRNIEIENHALSKIVMDSETSEQLSKQVQNNGRKISDLTVLGVASNSGVEPKYLEKSNNILQELRECINECMERLSFFTRVPLTMISPSSVSGGKITAEATKASLDPFGRKVGRYQLLSEDPISQIRRFYDGQEMAFSWKNPVDALGGDDTLELLQYLAVGVVDAEFVRKKKFAELTKEEIDRISNRNLSLNDL